MANAAWDNANLTDPHTVADKRSRVQRMFSAIAPSYDLNNRLHSFWRDQAWRRAAVKMAEVKASDVVVDVACGTGDLTLAFANAKPAEVIGIDFTYDMLRIANRKSRIADCKFLNGDALALPLPDACCDVVSIAFGIRNVQDVDAALKEFYRVLRPGGRVIVLEFSEPTNPVLRALNRFYCGKVMPITATLISRDKSGAYKYLPKSVATFFSRQQMVEHLQAAGFTPVTQRTLTFGVCVCYRGDKPR
jgi:demethylmenaquinone methyltransferase/2-methoxy-6-polyprenyl-1,4-benzoquinol methylase